MPVATYTLPNFPAQLASAYKTNIDGAFQVFQRFGAWFAPHQSSPLAMTVTLDAGWILTGSLVTPVAAQTTGTITAPTTNPRIDRVVIDSLTGAVSVVTGTEAASPVAPAVAAGKIPIAQIALATSTTQITNSILTDERVFLGGGTLVTHSNQTASGSAVNFLNIPPGVVRILLLYQEISLTGAGNVLVQLGTSVGLENTGYNSVSEGQASSSAFVAGVLGAAGDALTGEVTFTRRSGNIWISSHGFGRSGTAAGQSGGGVKQLSGEIDRLTAAPSAGTFDNGTFALLTFR